MPLTLAHDVAQAFIYFDYKYDVTKQEIYGNRTYSEFMKAVIDGAYQSMRANSFMIC